MHSEELLMWIFAHFRSAVVGFTSSQCSAPLALIRSQLRWICKSYLKLSNVIWYHFVHFRKTASRLYLCLMVKNGPLFQSFTHLGCVIVHVIKLSLLISLGKCAISIIQNSMSSNCCHQQWHEWFKNSVSICPESNLSHVLYVKVPGATSQKM